MNQKVVVRFLFNHVIAILTVAASVVLFIEAKAQSQPTDNRTYSSLQFASNPSQSASLYLQPCAPTPCVIPPIWPSTSVFTADAPIAANPQNSKQLLLGSVDQNCPQSPGLGFYLSNDAGSSWQRRCLPTFSYKGNEYDPAGNPMVGFDSRGTAYEAAYYLIRSDFSSAALVAFQNSTDGGETWSAPAPALGHADSIAVDAWLAVDTTPSSPYVNSVYISGVLIGPLDLNTRNQVVVSHSGDGGKTWTQVPVYQAQISPFEDWYTNLTVGKDGTVYVTWMYCNEGQSQGCIFGKGNMLFSKSSDGGNTWSKPTLITPVHLTYPLPNTTNVRVFNFPVIGVDNSNGQYAGNLYAAAYSWTGTYMRVGVIRSTDGGNTWSKPVPVAPASATHDQSFPWLSVSPAGLVGVSWMDRRNDPANVDYQAFAAISRDGGQSFGPNVQLTPGFSDPNRGGAGNGWIGDYTGNTWAGPSNFVAAWMDNSNTPLIVDVVGGIRLK